MKKEINLIVEFENDPPTLEQIPEGAIMRLARSLVDATELYLKKKKERSNNG